MSYLKNQSYFGYIEGYYGRMLSWEDRNSILDCMSGNKLNTYLYAPKEDPFHRQQWKIPYPKTWQKKFTQFIDKADKLHITIIPSMAPGLTFDYGSEADYKTLLTKFKSLVANGAKTVALLMDDIPEQLPASCTKKFTSLGQAHALLLAKLKNDLHTRYPAVSLWFCPTVYADSFTKDGVQNNQYLKDLAAGFSKDITLLWTGPAIISQALDKSCLQTISDMFNGNVVIWDNLYANDYCPAKLFVGPYFGRAQSAKKVTRGILLNPTGLLHTDIFLLYLLASFVNYVAPKAAWKNIIDKLSIPNEFVIVAAFFDMPFSQSPYAALTKQKNVRMQKALSYLIWKWKSPFQQEWYPFLFSLDTNLKLIENIGQKKLTAKWLAKKYPPIEADILALTLLQKRVK